MIVPLTTLRGPVLNPQADGSVLFLADGAIQWEAGGRITFVGHVKDLPAEESLQRKSRGVILPPFIDCHTHIPQWPIRGRFCEGIVGCPADGRLLAGLNRNVFPAEGKFADPLHVAETVAAFRRDTIAHGVVGGSAYVTVHPAATAEVLRSLPSTWSAGLVLMNMNCPAYLHTNETTLETDIQSLAGEFGDRLIVTDRFAVTADSPLRRRGAGLAARFGLRMQTHLNEQLREKEFVEKTLYPASANYTDVYRQDGLLGQNAIMAHCVVMNDAEFDLLADAGAAVAHCPVSNSLLGSGIMPLDRVMDRGIPYAICTDVGASSTTSLLCEMAQFLKVHAGRSKYATPSEALFRTTLAAARMMGLDDELGTFSVGRAASFIEVSCSMELPAHLSADDVILRGLLEMAPVDLSANPDGPLGAAAAVLALGGLEAGPELDGITQDFRQTVQRLDRKVNSVTIEGQIIWDRP